MNIIDYFTYLKILFYALFDYDYKRYHLSKYKSFCYEFNKLVEDNKLKRTMKRKWKKTFFKIGANPEEFYLFKLYEKNNEQINSYVTLFRQYYKIVCNLNRHSNVEVLNNKAKFNTFFNKLIGRRWISINNNQEGIKEFRNFIKSEKQIVLKPIKDSCGGSGIKFIDTDNVDDSIISQIDNDTYICESIIKQDGILNKINPSSVNTVRIISIRNNNEIDLCLSVLRMSNGSSRLDNIHSGGIFVDVNINTGTLVKNGYDRYGNTYNEHPVSKIKFDGLKINNWDNAIKTVKEAHSMIKDINYIGWDVVINKNEVFLIEGNHDSDIQGFQHPENYGFWKIFEKYTK